MSKEILITSKNDILLHSGERCDKVVINGKFEFNSKNELYDFINYLDKYIIPRFIIYNEKEEEYRQEARELERLDEEREFKDYIIDKLDHN